MNPVRWHSIWSGRGWLARLLWPVSLLYGWLFALRSTLFSLGLLKAERLAVPVVVVGNVVVGGAGKTPTVIALVKHLQRQGWSPGVVSRGYGRHSDAVLPVVNDTAPADSGDEPALIWRATGVPVWVAARRVEAARALLAAHPGVDVLVCDDGLQHLALARDLAVVVFDDRGTGNGWLLPAGLLREPWPPRPSNRFRPDLVLHQRPEGLAAPTALTPSGLPEFGASRRLADAAVGPRGQRVALQDLRGQALTAVAGIARPEVFFEMLRARGLTLARTLALPDHADSAAYAELLRCPRHPGVHRKGRGETVRRTARRPRCGLGGSAGVVARAGFLDRAGQPAGHARSGMSSADPQARLSSPHGHQTA
jgi:tetraacyldisaccharide 4'-kinase